ncbi:Peroxisome biosynthesis protein pex1 [Borealophlyctis nickersoniae]|nr:Peroxisome biosynthesis protein pex1 [Borealophlyctis nickersoniae]
MANTLTIALVDTKSCFVNLPAQWSAALWDIPQALRAGEVVLALSWRDRLAVAGSSKKHAYVGWAGGTAGHHQGSLPTDQGNVSQDRLEIDTQYGRVLGLVDGQKVSVEFCKDAPAGNSVHVEPLTADDWEILELHAGYLEEQLLNQVRVVYKDQIFTVWVHQQTIIRLLVVETNPAGKCVKLGVDAEVIVAPKQRRSLQPPSQNTPTNLSSNDASPTLTSPRVTARLIALESAGIALPSISSEDFELTVYMNRRSMVLQLNTPAGASERPVLFLHRIDFNSVTTEERGDSVSVKDVGDDSQEGVRTLPGIYAYVCFSPLVPEGHIVANRLFRNLIDALPFSRLSLRAAPPPLKSPKILVHQCKDSTNTVTVKLRSADSEQPKLHDSFKAFLKDQLIRGRHFILTDGMTMVMPTSSRHDSKPPPDITLLIRLPSAQGKASGAGKSALPTYCVLTPDIIDTLVFEQGTDVPRPVVQASTDKSTGPLGGMNKTIQDATQYVKSRLGRAGLRCSLRTPGLGGLLIYGAHGCGKTSLAETIANELGKDLSVLSHSVFVNCTKLVNERVANVKSAWGQAFASAAWHAPSIVIFDDIDRLMPAAQENSDSTRSRQLVEIFLELSRRACERHRITFIATCQQETSIHALLTTSHIFGTTIHIMAPTRPQREQILETILSTNSELCRTSLPSLDLTSIARETEGYLAADLKTLVQRAVQESAMRIMRETMGKSGSFEEKAKGDDNPLVAGITQEDFVVARDGYVPSSLRAVKLQSSEVSWDDIGGLGETKRVLLETLEWPTKYAAIFANCPLRLRSGLLLYGFPGCGKTLLASAVAKECGLNFISVKGPELLNKYIGASEQSVRDLFDRAQAARPCVLFFDEFDSIAPRRGHDNTGVTDRVVNQLLTQMDGAETVAGVYVLAATSRPDLIDPALLRPGRLDKSLLCGLPDEEERYEILSSVARKLHLASDTDLRAYAAKAEDFTGADLQALLYNAHLEAIHELVDAAGIERDEKKTANSESSDAAQVEFVGGSGIAGEKVAMTAAQRMKVAERIGVIQNNLSGGGRNSDQAGNQSQKETHAAPRAAIRPEHMDKALETTKASITMQEKRRLQSVYDEFVGKKPASSVNVGQRATLA